MQPIQKRSLAREVADALEHSIKSGALPLDARLPTEPELMKSFGVGRSSIREAIKILAESGFVQVQQGLGTFVISITGKAELSNKIEQADFAEVFEVRQILELKIIEKAALNRTKQDLQTIRKALQERNRFAKDGALAQSIKWDIAFHTGIAESCGNSILSALYKTLSEHVERFFHNLYQDTAPFLSSQTLHEELLQYIEEQNPQKALKTAQKIIGKI